MNILIISGSPRSNSQSLRVSKIIMNHINTHIHKNAEIFDVANNYSVLASRDSEQYSEKLELNMKIKSADALIIVSPEHSGMAPPALKSFFMQVEMPALAHKPALIIGISNGLGGTYPIAELRSTTIKNSHILYIPEHVIIRNVEYFTDELTNEFHQNISQRIKSCLQILFVYASLLKSHRIELLEITKNIRYGM